MLGFYLGLNNIQIEIYFQIVRVALLADTLKSKNVAKRLRLQEAINATNVKLVDLGRKAQQR